MPTLGVSIGEDITVERPEMPLGIYRFRIPNATLADNAAGDSKNLVCEVDIVEGPKGASDPKKFSGPLFGGKKKLYISLKESVRWRLKAQALACGISESKIKDGLATEDFIGAEFECEWKASSYTDRDTGEKKATQDFGKLVISSKK